MCQITRLAILITLAALAGNAGAGVDDFLKREAALAREYAAVMRKLAAEEYGHFAISCYHQGRNLEYFTGNSDETRKPNGKGSCLASIAVNALQMRRIGATEKEIEACVIGLETYCDVAYPEKGSIMHDRGRRP